MKTKVSYEKKIIKQLKEANDDFIEMLYILGIVGIPEKEIAKLIKQADR